MLKKDNTEGELCEREKGVLVKGNFMKIVGKKNMLVESRSYLQERERERDVLLTATVQAIYPGFSL